VKRCPDCGKYKPLSEFPRNRRTKNGFATTREVTNRASVCTEALATTTWRGATASAHGTSRIWSASRAMSAGLPKQRASGSRHCGEARRRPRFWRRVGRVRWQFARV